MPGSASAGDSVSPGAGNRGSNWGYGMEPDQVRFAHQLIHGGVDLIHGHSSHHPRPIEVFRGRLVLYG